MRQLAKDNFKCQQAALEMEKKAKVQELRVEQANLRMKKIETEEIEKCRKTAALLKEFEANSCKGPFFDALLEILINFQGSFLHK